VGANGLEDQEPRSEQCTNDFNESVVKEQVMAFENETSPAVTPTWRGLRSTALHVHLIIANDQGKVCALNDLVGQMKANLTHWWTYLCIFILKLTTSRPTPKNVSPPIAAHILTRRRRITILRPLSNIVDSFTTELRPTTRMNHPLSKSAKGSRSPVGPFIGTFSSVNDVLLPR
jgi:hypothetical protein